MKRGWANQGKADLILDNLIAQENKAMPMIIVMPDGNVESMGIFGEMTLKMFEAELKNCIIPFVEKLPCKDGFRKPCTCRLINGWYTDPLCWD